MSSRIAGAIRFCGPWSEHLSSSGRIYYYNYKTKANTWKKPSEWDDSRAIKSDEPSNHGSSSSSAAANNHNNKRRASMINSQSSNSLEHSSSNSNNLRPPTKKPLIEEIPKRQSYQSYREHNQNSHGSNSSRDHGQNHNHNLSKSYHSGMRDHNRGSYSRSASQYHQHHHDRDRQGPDLLPKGSTLDILHAQNQMSSRPNASARRPGAGASARTPGASNRTPRRPGQSATSRKPGQAPSVASSRQPQTAIADNQISSNQNNKLTASPSHTNSAYKINTTPSSPGMKRAPGSKMGGARQQSSTVLSNNFPVQSSSSIGLPGQSKNMLRFGTYKKPPLPTQQTSKGHRAAGTSSGGFIRDPSALLMSVIRTLAQGGASKKDAEKDKLEEAFHETDNNLEKAVEQNYDELSSTIKTFGAINSEISVARGRVSQILQKLTTCKQQLHCRQDELRKLWDEGLEQDKILSIMKEISTAKMAPENIDKFIANRHYLHAARLCTTTDMTLDKFQAVDALHELRTDMVQKKSELTNKIIDELHDHIYYRSIKENLKSDEEQIQATRKKKRNRNLNGINGNIDDQPDQPVKKEKVVYDEQGHPLEELVEVNPDERPNQYTAVLVQAFCELNGLMDIISAIKVRKSQEIEKVISRTALFISDQNYYSAKLGNQNSNLTELLEILFLNFKSIAKSHRFLIKCLRKLARQLRDAGFDQEDIPEIYTMEDVWSKIIANLTALLTSYLDDSVDANNQIDGGGAGAQTQTANYSGSTGQTAANPTSNDFWKVSSLSTLSNQQNDNNSLSIKKPTLFRFDGSTHAKSMNEYLRDQRRANQNSDQASTNQLNSQLTPNLLCQPSPRNVTVIYKPLHDFVIELDEMENGYIIVEPLKDFIEEHIKKTFMQQVKNELMREMDSAVKVADPLKVLTEGGSHSSSVPLLKSSVVVEHSMSELSDLAVQLGMEFRTPLLKMLSEVLQEFHGTIKHHYNQLIKMCEPLAGEGSATLSQQNNNDYDTDFQQINAICQASNLESDTQFKNEICSLLNWKEALGQNKRKKKKAKPQGGQMRKVYKQESEILVERLLKLVADQKNDIPYPHDMNYVIGGALQDLNDCDALAHVHESLEWLTIRMSKMINKLAPVLESDELNIMETITNLRNNFQILSEKCLVVLHLDLRVRCFTKLIPMMCNNDYNQENYNQFNPYSSVNKEHTDKEADALSRQFDELSDKLQISLQANKFKYVFNGCGVVVSNLMTDACELIKNQKINQQGVKRICRNIFAIQQKLTNITLTREAELDTCRQFYELLYTTPEEFIMQIQENGLKYTSGRLYLSLFDLLYKSMGNDVDTNKWTSNRRKLIDVISTFEAKTEKKSGELSYIQQAAKEMGGGGIDIYDRTKY